jgi:luciferase family oxidoreductase group 1
MFLMSIAFSVLDLCPLFSGVDATKSFEASVQLAQFTENLGYKRFWLAEHHSMEGIGSSAPEVLIAHIASATKKIRVGSGGIMLPNHPALHIAEVFRTLEALYPGRIDLGLGRAPGSGSKAAHALRRARGLSAEDFPQEFDDLIKWLTDDIHEGHPYFGVHAVPTKINMPGIWILGSSDYGAQFAAHYGMPYAFAQHFSHAPALEIIRMYREEYRPSKWYPEPKVILGTHVICAETDEKAKELALSSDLSFSIFVNSGKSIPLPTVEEAKAYGYTAKDWDDVRRGSMPKMVGSPEKVKKFLDFYINSKMIDEVMMLSMIHDQEARRKSYELTWNAFH